MAAKDSVKTEEVAVAPAPEVIAADLQTAEPAKKMKAVVIAGGSTIPKADLVVVVQTQTFKPGKDAKPATETEAAEPGEPAVVTIKKSHYPSGGHVYLRFEDDVQFPADAPEVLTLGKNVEQLYMRGFTRAIGYLNVGPAHPAFAAANLAYQRGATEIEIVGLGDAEKEKLQPWFDELPKTPAEPALVAVSFT